MGHSLFLQDSFDHEPKTALDPHTSVQSIDKVTPDPAQESTLQLFEGEPLADEQQWRPGVRDWLVFICIAILAMMDAFDASVLIPTLPVSRTRILVLKSVPN
jgi:hypothetical protein